MSCAAGLMVGGGEAISLCSAGAGDSASNALRESSASQASSSSSKSCGAGCGAGRAGPEPIRILARLARKLSLTAASLASSPASSAPDFSGCEGLEGGAPVPGSFATTTSLGGGAVERSVFVVSAANGGEEEWEGCTGTGTGGGGGGGGVASARDAAGQTSSDPSAGRGARGAAPPSSPPSSPLVSLGVVGFARAPMRGAGPPRGLLVATSGVLKRAIAAATALIGLPPVLGGLLSSERGALAWGEGVEGGAAVEAEAAGGVCGVEGRGCEAAPPPRLLRSAAADRGAATRGGGATLERGGGVQGGGGAGVATARGGAGGEGKPDA
mmetsp:Transcript_11902/g.22720  ORF Transcript_11902/g.22720 Transcript_11902/m.22720 type:complete len:326 (+) Transcript_11902:254-1231(+)